MSNNSPFKRATKKGARVRMAIEGPAGSGKTYSALAIATELGGSVLFVDTEAGSAQHYADLFEFDLVEMKPPFAPHRFVKAIAQGVEFGYATIIIDSLSHAWEGEGGLLEIVDQIQKSGNRGDKGFAAWKKAVPKQRALVDAIIRSRINVICCMRTKNDWIMVEKRNRRGETTQAPEKVGTKTIQKDGMDFEFDIVLRMDGENFGSVIKTRCPALSEQGFKHPGAQVAGILREWLTGRPKMHVDPNHAPTDTPQSTRQDEGERKEPLPFGTAQKMAKALDEQGIPIAAVAAWRANIGKDSIADMGPNRRNNLTRSLLGLANPKACIERRTDFAAWLDPGSTPQFELMLSLLAVSRDECLEWAHSSLCDFEIAGRATDPDLHEALLSSKGWAEFSQRRLAASFEAAS